MTNRKQRIVYCTPSLYIAGGVERVLTSKANYLAAQDDRYEVTFILTDGKGKSPFYPLSDKVQVINLGIEFEELWSASFFRKILIYLKKQRQFKRMLREELMRLRPDITISTLRREVNFITSIPDGSKKIGELHVNRQNYRNFEANDSNVIKRLFEKWWMRQLVTKLRKLDRFVVLTHEDAQSWKELDNVTVIPDPLMSFPATRSPLKTKRVIAVGRYTYQKGFDLLLRAWSMVEKAFPEWSLAIYGMGNRTPYQQLAEELQLDMKRCHLNESTSDIGSQYMDSSIFVLSSRFEGFGMVLVEAMSYGLPCVSFACPCGPRDIVDHPQNGLLVENGNVEQLASEIIRLAKDAALRQSLADKALVKSREYDISRIGPQWEELFKIVCT